MASISLLSSIGNTTNALWSQTETQKQTQNTADTVSTASTASTEQDTVKLSEKAQAKMLHNQGQSVSAIASALGTTSKAVDDYLGIEITKELENAIQATLTTTA